MKPIAKPLRERIQESIDHRDWLIYYGAPKDFIDCENKIIDSLMELEEKSKASLERRDADIAELRRSIQANGGKLNE